jgi:hypothetical protein
MCVELKERRATLRILSPIICDLGLLDERALALIYAGVDAIRGRNNAEVDAAAQTTHALGADLLGHWTVG